MPNTPLTIPSLVGGVSRQPPNQRQINQLVSAENVSLFLARGLTRRPGTETIISGDTDHDGLDLGSLSQADAEDWFTHWIVRGSTRYLMVIGAHATAPVMVYRMDGSAVTVAYDTSVADPRTYLNIGSGTRRASLRAVTIADTTLVMNTEVVVVRETGTLNYLSDAGGGSPTASPSNRPVREFDTTTPTNSPRNVAAFANLPRPPAANDQIWFLREDSPGFPSGFYKSKNYNSTGPYWEPVQTEHTKSAFNVEKMPIKIAYDEGTDTFIVSPITWAPRLSGDPDTNPGPSFVGKKLTAMAFHSNRLWLSADESVASSCDGDYFNFWIRNPVNITDTDPIDVSVADSSVTKITSMLSFQKALAVFTDAAKQFEIRSATNLAPSTVSVLPTTKYASEASVMPVRLGNQMYFAASETGYGQVFEYLYIDQAASNVANDVTAHAFDYIPGPVREFTVSENNDLLICSTDSDANSLYLLYQRWSGVEKNQMGWCRWTFDDPVISHHVFGTDLYIVIRRNSRISIEKVWIGSGQVFTSGLPFAVRLDRRISVTGVYDSSSRTTSFSLPFKDDECSSIVLGSGWASSAGRLFEATVDEAITTYTKLILPGKYDTAPVIVGRKFVSVAQLSEQFVRDQDGRVRQGRLTLRTMTVFYRDSGYFEVRVTPKGRQTDRHVWTAPRIGTLTSILNRIGISKDGQFGLKPMCPSDGGYWFDHGGTQKASGTIIEIWSDAHVPFSITEIRMLGGFIPSKQSAST